MFKCGQQLFEIVSNSKSNPIQNNTSDIKSANTKQSRSSSNKKDNKKPWSLKTILISFFALVFLYGLVKTCLENLPNSTASNEVNKVEVDEDSKKVYALRYAQAYVKKMLKAPKSAEFPSLFEGIKQVHVINENRFLVKSYVDSQNEFGALIRTEYFCKVEVIADQVSLIEFYFKE